MNRNPYNFGGSILRFLDCNYVDSDPNKGFRELLGFAISAKRYCIYLRDGGGCTIIDPKAHGLGYVYPPSDSPPGWDEEHEIPKWVYEGWEWLVRHGNNLTPNHLPPWSTLPQMMRMAVNTHDLLKRLHRWNKFRPFNFFFAPVLANCGQPANVDPQRFTLVTRFERDQSKWMDAPCFNIDDRNDTKQYELTTAFDSPHFGERPIVETFEELLYRYFYHPESKSLGPDGEPCQRKTRGRLERPHVIGGKPGLPLGTDNAVSVINGATNAVVSTITVGTGPYGVGVNPATNMIYVANHSSDTVSVISGK